MHKISDVMSRDVKTIGADSTIAEAAKAMRDGDFGMMPVDENDKMIGAISDRDIAIRAVAEGMDGSAKVRDVMSDGIRWVYEDETLERASEIMSEHQVRRLPVIDRSKRLVGIVALADLAVKDTESGNAAEALTEISEPA